MLLDKIEKANDIKKIDKSDYGELAEEIRQFLIQKISVTGGHLGSNLGAVELTMALHLALNLPEDKIIWDVGHQSYTHKILTGRKDGFDVLRQFHGMSGFPKRKESSYDAFDTGHSSTSISAGLGLVKARDLKGEKTTIVSVIGDGSLTGGMAYEALNNAAKLETNFIVILNDNNMSISENVGGVSKYLNNIRTATGYLDLKEGIYNALKSKPGGDGIVNRLRRAKSSFKQLVIPGMFFEDMGVTYLGPVDGHDIEGLIKVIEEAKRVKGAVLIHVMTQKGKGYGPAEKHPARFHGAEPFDIETGIPSHPRTVANYTDVFSTVMCKLGQRDERVVAITAAMPDGTGLKRFRNMYPDRFFDVGIAEEHAVTFAAGLATSGLVPVVAIYSSFLQRAYDQILHDVCLQKLHVIFAIDRSGLVGADGDTHQGIFDTAFLSHIPNMTIIAPKNRYELTRAMEWAVAYDGPVALKYSRGEAYYGLKEYNADIEYGRSEMIHRGQKLAIVAVGNMVQEAEKVYDRLLADGTNVTFVNARFLKPIDTDMIDELSRDHEHIVVIEEEIKHGGYGSLVEEYVMDRHLDVDVTVCAIEDTFVQHGSVEELRRMLKLDADSLYDRIKHIISTDCTE